MNNVQDIVDKQLAAYNKCDYETFASYYDPEITSYDLHTSVINHKMSRKNFFDHYREKFIQNPNIQCEVTNRIVHGNLVIDEEILTHYQNKSHKECVIYQVDNGRITKMWYTPEIPCD